MSGRKRGESPEQKGAALDQGQTPSADRAGPDLPADGPDAPTVELSRLRAREDELLRALAEQHNIVRRRRQEMESAVLYSQEELVRELLPVLDDFERALKAMEGKDETIRSGVAMVHDRLLQALERQGLAAIRPRGERFDPALHDALAEQAGTGAAPGTIVEVVQPGYRFRDRVLRHAKVVVAGPSESAGTPPAAGAPSASGAPR